MRMIAYMSRRFLRAALLLTGVSLLSFALIEAAPGDYFDEIRLNPSISSQTIDALRKEYGLDQPIAVRYLRWCASVFRGEWGFSIAYRRSAGPILLERATNTLILTATATALTWLAALAAFIWAASGRTWRQQLVVAVTAILVALPDLVIILGLTMIASSTQWFPSGGMTSVNHASLRFSERLADSALHLALPIAALV